MSLAFQKSKNAHANQVQTKSRSTNLRRAWRDRERDRGFCGDRLRDQRAMSAQSASSEEGKVLPEGPMARLLDVPQAVLRRVPRWRAHPAGRGPVLVSIP